jgi:hypothetical protein
MADKQNGTVTHGEFHAALRDLEKGLGKKIDEGNGDILKKLEENYVRKDVYDAHVKSYEKTDGDIRKAVWLVIGAIILAGMDIVLRMP